MPEQHRSDTLPAFRGSDLDTCLARARTGDQRAFELLCDLLSPRVEAYLTRFLRSDADAASAALQDAWTAAFQRLSAFESDEHLVGWLCRVAKCRAIDSLQKAHRTTTTAWSGSFSEHLGPLVPAARALEGDREYETTVQTAIANLPDIYRGIATLHFVYGQQPREVALLLGLRLPTVKMRLHRARLLLRRSLRSVEPP